MSSLSALSFSNTTDSYFDVVATFTSNATSNTFRYRLKVSVPVNNGVNYYYSDELVTSASASKTFTVRCGIFDPNTTYNVTAVIEYYDTGAANPVWTASSLTSSGSVTTSSNFNATFSYVNYTYPSQYSYNGQWSVDVNLTFQHESPTYGTYQYKVKYWYFDQTAGESTSPDYFTNTLLDEYYLMYPHSHSHAFVVNLNLTAGHTYAFNAELWYRTIDSNGRASSWASAPLPFVGRQTITVKAAADSALAGEITNVNVSVNGTSVTISWQWTTAGTSKYFSGAVHISRDQDFSSHEYSSDGPRSGSGSFSASFSNLNEDDFYYYRIVMIGADSNSMSPSSVVAVVTGTFATSSGDPSIPDNDLWVWSWEHVYGSWNYRHASATPEQTAAAYTAVTTPHSATTDFSHKVWNDLNDWLKDNLSILEIAVTILPYTGGTAMTSSDTVLTSDRWNVLVKRYNALVYFFADEYGVSLPLMSYVSTGDTVYAFKFVDLVDTMNSYIMDY